MPKLSLSLIKLLDEAVVPAFLVIGTKVITFLLLCLAFGLPLPFPSDFPALLVLNQVLNYDTGTFILVSSVSSMVTFLVIILFFGWVIIKAHHFHETHISPRFHQKLVKTGWDHLVQSSHEIYHQGLVWLSLTWLFFFYVVFSTFLGLTVWWVPLLGIAIVFALTMMMLEDVINEIKIQRANK